MNRFLILILLCPLATFGQISFIKEHVTGAYAHEVSRPYELSNGNFVCSVLHGKNNIWYNVLYLFSECGELITTLQVSTPDEYVYVSNFAQLDSITMLATAYVADPNWHTLYMVLDINTLQIVKERMYYETSLHEIDKTFLGQGLIYQLGFSGSRIMMSRLNENLSRNFHLNRIFEDVEYKDLRYIQPAVYSRDRIYSREQYRDSAFDEHTQLRCLDGLLRDVYTINLNTDTTLSSIYGTIGFLGGDTLLIGGVDHEKDGDDYQAFVRMMYRDTLLYEKKVQGFDQFFHYTACEFLNGKLRCINYNGEIGIFDKSGELLFYTDHLTEILSEGDMIGAITTQDGGVFSVADSYIQVDGVWVEVLKIVKTTNDYQISESPHPKCIVATNDLHISSNVVVYPNPATSTVHIASEEPVIQYRVYSSESKLLLSGHTQESEFDIDFDLLPGMYVIQIETPKGWFAQKLLIVK